MNIASLIVFFLSAALLVWAEEEEEHKNPDVRKLRDIYNDEGSTLLYNFTKEDCTLNVKWKIFTESGEEKRLIITASYGGRDLGHYSMPQFTIDANDTDDALIQRLKDNMNLERFFDFQKKQIHDDQFFIVKYLQTSLSPTGIWWCDVYKTEAYIFTQVDKCFYVENGMEAMLDPLYISVNSDSQDQLMFRTGTWAKCDGQNLTSICKDPFTGIELYKELWCNESTPKGYKILLYDAEENVGTYTLSNSENLESDTDTTKVCKLFNFATKKFNDNTIEEVYVRIMNKPDATQNDWQYKCQSYEVTVEHSEFSHDLKYNKKGESTCDNYEEAKHY